VLRLKSGLLAGIGALLALAIAGCETTPSTGGIGGGDDAQQTVVASDWGSVGRTKVSCNAATDACAKAHAARGDACLRLAIQQPATASASDTRMRQLLDCAEEGYRQALLKQPGKNAPSRISYHGGLLLTLSERRNRLDDLTKEKKLDRENDKLLIAAQDARREVPSSALGYLYGASAHVYRAAMKPRGRDRCNDLRMAETMLQRSPSPPKELAAEQDRMRTLTQRELRDNACPRIRRR